MYCRCLEDEKCQNVWLWLPFAHLLSCVSKLRTQEWGKGKKVHHLSLASGGIKDVIISCLHAHHLMIESSGLQTLPECPPCYLRIGTNYWVGFPGGSDSKESACSAGGLGLIPGSGRSPGEGNGNPLQYSCLGNPVDWAVWWATVCGIKKSQTQLSNCTFTLTQSMKHALLFARIWFKV